MKSAGKKWCKFDFGQDLQRCEKEKTTALKKTITRKSNNSNPTTKDSEKIINNFNFHNKLIPKSVSELAVHPKKIKELQEWFQLKLKGNLTKVNSRFLLLTGPTGAGKTTAINVLCKELGVTVSEWINPVDQDFESYPSYSSQVSRFTEFLCESNKYKSLFHLDSNQKVIIVEDFPNVVIRNPEEFFTILEKCSYNCIYPVIFICTDSLIRNGLQLSYTLFPQEIREKYNIDNISFNSCADTLLKNALKRAHHLVQEHKDLFKTPPGHVVDAIIASSMGDIRCAVNQYYLAALQGGNELLLLQCSEEKVGTKRKRINKNVKIENMLRDECLGLFHGVGRVLNPKLIVVGKLKKLNCDVEKIVGEFSSQPHTFIAFLFENYIRYYGDVGDICRASEIISMAEMFLSNWTDRQETLNLVLWLSILGLMIFNEHKVSKWMQIRGPKKIAKLVSQDLVTRRLQKTELYYYNIINKDESSRKFIINT